MNAGDALPPRPEDFVVAVRAGEALPAREAAPDNAGEASPERAVEAAARRSSYSLWNAPATYLLLGINIVVFAVMIGFGPLPELARQHAFGAMLTAPFDINVLAYFGGCDGLQVLDGHQWWRLLTAAFVHVSLLHLLVNMWCLWNLGLLGEPLLGRQGLVATYALTGIAGNLCSLAFNALLRQDALVAGASGAVFGIAGILIVLLSNRKLSLPWTELRALRRSVIQFAVLNLIIGLAPQVLLPVLPGTALSRMPVDLSPLAHIDNTAHLGGFFCGLAMGWPLFSRMMSGRTRYRQRQRVVFAAAALVLTLGGYAVAVFHAR
jgi:rhomboid protease GluP